MSMLSHLGPLLTQKPIVLVVEDRITKEYLLAAWGAEQQYFNVITAGGCDVVDGFVTDLRKHRVTHVFGLLDRDFGTTNKSSWAAPINPPPVFRLPRHELENYLLDWDGLAGCDLNQKRHNRSAAEIEARGNSEAGKQPWWLACRGQLHELQKALGTDFPKHPPLGTVSTERTALDFITGSRWFTGLTGRIAAASDAAALQRNLQTAGAAYSAHLTGAGWIQEFSGKEVFAGLQSYVYDVPGKSNPEPDVDLAKSIGAWQFANGKVPTDIQELKEALKLRVKLA